MRRVHPELGRRLLHVQIRQEKPGGCEHLEVEMCASRSDSFVKSIRLLGLTLSSSRSDSLVLKQADWQHVANSLLRQFTIIAEPLPAAALMSLATCSTFLPQAIGGETSFCVQLRDDTPDTSLDGKISYTKTYSHDMPIRFDGDDYRIEFEEATYAEDEDTTLTVWLRWEPKQQPPYDGFSGLAKCYKDGAFAAVRARMHCLFLDPQPQLTEVSSDGEAVLRTAFGEIPKHVFQGDGTGWGTSIGSNFGARTLLRARYLSSFISGPTEMRMRSVA